MRIIGGFAGGQLLDVPAGLSVRPTPDRVRQAVFNSLGSIVEGAEVLDLFSGSGALGLECLSRGARRVVSVELSPRHAVFIRENARRLQLPPDRHQLRVQDVLPAMRQLHAEGARFDLIMADPPFGAKTARGGRSRSWSQRLMEIPETARLLRGGGRLVLGHARRDQVSVPPGWVELRMLSHGDSIFRMLRWEGGEPPGAASDLP